MPIGTCDPATRGQAYNEIVIERPAPDSSGSVVCDIRFGWDGVSTRETGCDGPITRVHVRNNSNIIAWANLPAKKAGNRWIQIDPGTDVITTSQGQLNNLGLTKVSDVANVNVVFVQPA